MSPKFVHNAVNHAAQAPFRLAYTGLHAITVRRARQNSHYRWYEQEFKREDKKTVLTIDDLKRENHLWENMHGIEQHVSPAPRLESWLDRTARENILRDFPREAKFAWQRLTRGWDDRATWSLDRHTYRTLGAQLIRLADTTHGWPESAEFPEFEDWQNALRHHGNILLKASEWETTDVEKEEQAQRDALVSMYWVTDHLFSLWD